MAKIYSPQTWINELLLGEELYTITPVDSVFAIELATPVINVGTPLNATRMNHIENGIDELDTRVDELLTSETILRSAGFIGEASGQLVYESATSYSVMPGAIEIEGVLLEWTSSIERTGLSTTANTLYYVYLYNNVGEAAAEESTTVPIWDETRNCFIKTGDGTRRCIGFIEASATNTIRNFLNTVYGKVSEIIYIDGNLTGRKPVNNNATSANWAGFSLAPLVPVHATHALFSVQVNCDTAGDSGLVGVSPIDLGNAVEADKSPNYVSGNSPDEPAIFSFGTSWNAIAEPQYYYVRNLMYSGTTAAIVEIHGARFIR